MLLRPGGVTKEQIESAAGPVLVDKGLTEEDEVPISPGMKYTHYAPSAPMAIAFGQPFIHKNRTGGGFNLLFCHAARTKQHGLFPRTGQNG